ncbi:fumarylacetoacetate hydrolase family protein [Gordonia sp. N1V]|uniref:2-keto-4-pentenoate hydratase n=1 Tax=Gordonia sp. N1V TaxID=3034163 RepID=UPI0023E2CB05|nr:fumarylacetoacetate hydrolase family protein [Gordonia sp. N1V]MDF3281041.1 fumarylacetoacetate hydrolase family protein [Gordonia sp. N1V]
MSNSIADPTVTHHAEPDAVRSAARRLVRAARSGTPCDPVRDLIGSTDVAVAYSVAELVSRERVSAGARIVGRKIGLTSAAVQAQLGVDQPDFGFLHSDMEFLGGDEIPADAVLQPRVEAEIAFVLAADLVGPSITEDQVRDAIAYAVPALEICGSRIRDWDISLADTVADNASAGAFVLGPRHIAIDHVEPRDVEMVMTVDREVVSTGSGSACLGDPIRAVTWLANQAQRFGQPLRARQVILSGALGPMVPVRPGASVRADLTGLGAVTVQFAAVDNPEAPDSDGADEPTALPSATRKPEDK